MFYIYWTKNITTKRLNTSITDHLLKMAKILIASEVRGLRPSRRDA
jgi:hypothetical protein